MLMPLVINQLEIQELDWLRKQSRSWGYHPSGKPSGKSPLGFHNWVLGKKKTNAVMWTLVNKNHIRIVCQYIYIYRSTINPFVSHWSYVAPNLAIPNWGPARLFSCESELRRGREDALPEAKKTWEATPSSWRNRSSENRFSSLFTGWISCKIQWISMIVVYIYPEWIAWCFPSFFCYSYPLVN